MTSLDPRRHAYRTDLADARLRGKVEAARFVEGRPVCVRDPVIEIKAAPDDRARRASEALHGEAALVFEEQQGWSFLQLERDGYVGYARSSGLGKPPAAESAAALVQIRAPVALEFEQPDIKSRVLRRLPMGAVLAGAAEGEFVHSRHGGYVCKAHVAGAETAGDFVAVAQQFAGVPYLWGGKTHFGTDCSGLVQISLQAAGIACPRDSDMQAAEVGALLPPEQWANLRRGDLVFWRGHAGLMTDAAELLHANAHHMRVTAEPLAGVIARAVAQGRPITAVRRIEARTATAI